MARIRFDSNLGDLFIPVDRNGLVIYFSISGEPFLFNGHTGLYGDSSNLPAYADQCYKTLLRPKEEQEKAFGQLIHEFGPSCQEFIREIKLFQSGLHPDLTGPQPQKRLNPRMSPDNISIYMARGCNLSCTYCINQQGSFGGDTSMMTLQVAHDVLVFILDLVRNLDGKSISICFLGGEPLLNSRAVRLISRGIQDFNNDSKEAKIYQVITTNGTIYDKELFDIFAEDPVRNTVSVSLDATKERHDKHRPFSGSSGKSSYDCVLKNIERMILERIPHSVTCVVPHPYDYVGAAEAMHRLGFKRIVIKPLIPYIMGKSVLPSAFEKDMDLWKKNYISYADYYLDQLEKADPVQHLDRVSLLKKYADMLSSQRISDTIICGVAGNTLAIDTNGDLMPCELFLGHPDGVLGNAREKYDMNKYEAFEKRILREGQLMLNRKECRTCFAKRICGGGCYAKHLDGQPPSKGADQSSCDLIRETIKIDIYFISQLRRRFPEFYAEILRSEEMENS